MVPVYNNEQYLNQLFKNLLNQTIGFENLEVVLINDGSTDNTELILKKFASKYENVTFLSNEKNKGAAYTRNRGIDTCTTDYLIFMDADDDYAENFIEIYYNTIIKHAADIVKSNFDVKENNETHQISFKENIVKSNDLSDFPLGLLLIAGNAIYNLKFLKENNLRFDEELKRSEDSLFHVECFLKSKKENVFLLNYKGTTWNIHDNSLSHSFSEELYNADWECYNKIIELFNNHNISEEYINNFTQFKVIQQKLRLIKSKIVNEEIKESIYKQMYKATLNIMTGYKETNVKQIKFF